MNLKLQLKNRRRELRAHTHIHTYRMPLINDLRLEYISFVTIFLMLILMQIQLGNCIDCFKCVSFNGANKACDDPFHNNYSTALLESPCMGGRKGRNGLFPATSCIKIAGIYDGSGESITVRGCALDSGTLTTDTEIVRMSHCGHFFFDDKYVHGCLQSCSDADACNTATSHKSTITIRQQVTLAFLVFISLHLHRIR